MKKSKKDDLQVGGVGVKTPESTPEFLPKSWENAALFGNGSLQDAPSGMALTPDLPPLKPKRRLERNAEHQKYILRDGSVVGGASSICRMGDSPEPLIRWANRMGLEGKDSTKFRDKAADKGTIFHFMTACFLEGFEPDLREFDNRDIEKAGYGFDKFLKFWEVEGLTVVASERQMVSESFRYGGTLDIVARDENGLLVLLDEKSSKAVYWSQICQLAGYQGLWDENEEEKIARRAILRTPPTDEGEFQVHWFPDQKIQKHLNIFRAQAALFNVIKANK